MSMMEVINNITDMLFFADTLYSCITYTFNEDAQMC